MRPLRVFLCHASQHKPAVRKFHRYLNQRGVQPWLDELDLLPGENWEVEIPKALFSSDVILVCLSKNSVDKEGYVQKEITFALDKAQEKPEGTIFIVPIKLEECEVPRRLKQYQWVDLFRQDGYKRLMLGLQKRASGLGADVSPVVLDETRRTPKPEKKKPEEQVISTPVPTPVPAPLEEEVKEEPKKEIPAPPQEEKEPEVKFTQQKPFTKLLEPSSLSPNGNPPVGRVSNPTQSVAPKKRQAKSLTYGFWGIGLLVLILGGIGLSSLLKNPPAATATDSPTPKPPTFTSMPFTHMPTLTKMLTSTSTQTPTPMPTLGIDSTMVSEKDGMTLLYIPAGEFAMGSENGGGDEKPLHTVYLDAFWIDQTEVTNTMFAKFIEDTGYETDAQKKGKSYVYQNDSWVEVSGADWEHPTGKNSAISGKEKHPVIHVSWNDAVTYCKWAGRRLSTEAEWEKVARGTGVFTYPWGNDFHGDIVNFCDTNCSLKWADKNYDDGYADTAPVGNYYNGVSPYRVYDMAGNVWEWVNDWYGDTYYQDSPSLSPLGPDSGRYRILRGGSWSNDVYDIRSTNRGWSVPTSTNDFLGFRCASSP